MNKINEISAGDFILAYKILKDLSRKWEDFEAYNLGLIDKDGNKLKSSETSEEKDSISSYYRIIFNLKRLIQKIVGKSTLAKTAVNMLLLKEDVPSRTVNIILKELQLTDLGEDSEDYIKSLVESSSIYK